MTAVLVSACKVKACLQITSLRCLHSAAVKRGYRTETRSCPPRPFAVPLARNCPCSPNRWFAIVQHRYSLPRLPVGSEEESNFSMCMYSTEKSVAKGLPFAITYGSVPRTTYPGLRNGEGIKPRQVLLSQGVACRRGES